VSSRPLRIGRHRRERETRRAEGREHVRAGRERDMCVRSNVQPNVATYTKETCLNLTSNTIHTGHEKRSSISTHTRTQHAPHAITQQQHLVTPCCTTPWSSSAKARRVLQVPATAMRKEMYSCSVRKTSLYVMTVCFRVSVCACVLVCLYVCACGYVCVYLRAYEFMFSVSWHFDIRASLRVWCEKQEE